MLVKTSKIMCLEKLKVRLAILSIAIFLTILSNAISISSFYKCYGVAGHSLSTAFVLALVIYLIRSSKLYLLALFVGYLLAVFPAYYLSTALTYAGRSDKVHNRIIIDGNLSAILIACLLVMLILTISCVNGKKLKTTLRVVSCFLWLVSIVQFVIVVFYGVNYGKGPTGPAIFAIIQTNFDEAIEYVKSQGEFLLYILVFLICLVPVLFWLIYKAHTILTRKFLTLTKEYSRLNLGITVGLLSVASLLVFCSLNLDNVYNSYRSAAITYYQQKDFRDSINERVGILDSLNLKDVETNEGLFVVIIGESLTRDHMSAYGYSRQTTPWLNEIKNNPSFYLFQNPYSAHVISAFALSAVLTSMNQYDVDRREMAQCPSIVEIAKAAGFNVTWLSNHTYYGLTSKPHSVIASAADNKVWINQYNNDVSFKTEYYDDELVDELNKYIGITRQNKKRIIFVHLFGNHAEYSHRYPVLFNKWTGTDESDTYDNSVLYNDSVVKEIYELASAQPDIKAIMYFSDHGEQMGVGHTPDAFTYSMARIPFWIYLSNSYHQEHPEVVQAIIKNIKHPFTNDLVFDIICGLTGITDHPYYSSNNDITSSNFSLRSEDVVILNTYKALDDKNYSR